MIMLFIAGLLISAVHAGTIYYTAGGNAFASSALAFTSTSLSMIVLIHIIQLANGSIGGALVYALGIGLGNFLSVYTRKNPRWLIGG